MPSFRGRVEARMTVPAGGAAVAALNANGNASTTTVTVPAANYYLTAAGGVSSLLTTLQTQLNNNRRWYPESAAAFTAAVGWGVPSAAWLCNEASSSLAAVFGSPSLTAVSTPTYGTAGPCGGVDLAVGFDSASDAFDGSTNFDPGTNDLVLACVAKFTATPSAYGSIISKIDATPTGGYALYVTDLGKLGFLLYDAGVLKFFESTSLMLVGEWMVILACIDRSTGKFRVGVRGLTSGTTSVATETAIGGSVTIGSTFRLGASLWKPPAFCNLAYVAAGSAASCASGMSANLSTALTNFAAAVNAAWSVSIAPSTDANAGRVSIGLSPAPPSGANTFSITWSNTTLRDILGFTANISGASTTQVGTKQAHGLWFPDTPLNLDDDPRQAPRQSDLRTSMSPTGNVLGLCGNELYQHANLRWERSPIAQIREASATYANASLETFWRDTQTAQGGVSWFSPASRVQVYWDNAGVESLLGSDVTISGWSITGAAGIRDVCKKADQRWTGQWTVKFPFLVSDG